MIQGKIKTYDYLYHLYLGTPDFCVFCDLVLETSDHLFRQCYISNQIWKKVEDLSDIKIILVDRIAWCDCIFRQKNLDVIQTANLAVQHVKEFLCVLETIKCRITSCKTD